MASFLPRDILINIFKRLPVKSLMRFQCVCKSWYSLIKESEFIQTYMEFTLMNPNSFKKSYIISDHVAGSRTAFDRFDETLSDRHVLEFPFRMNSYTYFEIAGSCNGVLCLTELETQYYGRVVYLWNPSIRRVKNLRESVIHNLPGPDPPSSAVGFGYDQVNADYKVVRMFYSKSVDPIVEVYCLRTDSWHRVSTEFPRVMFLNPLGVHLNGAIHWVYRRMLGKRIIAFDLSEETPRVFFIPDTVGNAIDYQLREKIWVYRGMLALISDNFDRFNLNKPTDFYRVWVMREYGVPESWTTLFRVDLRAQGNIVMPLFSGWNNELFLENKEGTLVSYWPDIRQFRVHGVKTGWHCVPYYMESLVLIDKGRDVREYISSFRGVKNRGVDLIIEERD